MRPIGRLGALAAAGSSGLLLAFGVTALPAQAASPKIKVRCNTQALIDAINMANATPATADTLILAKRCTYTLTTPIPGTLGSNGLPTVTSPITIKGNKAHITRASTAPPFRIFEVAPNGVLTLEHLTISRGDAAIVGGGIFNNRGAVTLLHSTVTDNSAGGGGGIRTTFGTVTLRFSKVTDNTASTGGGINNIDGTVNVHSSVIADNTVSGTGVRSGGGIFIGSNATLTVESSIIIRNAVNGVFARGGGIAIDGIATVRNSRIRFNTANGSSSAVGGGIVHNGDELTLLDSDVIGNTASGPIARGGGISNDDGTTMLRDSDVTRNTASGANAQGGGIFIGAGTTILELQDSKVKGNTASGVNAQGGGIANIGSTATLVDSDVILNTASDAPGGIFNSGGTITLDDDSHVKMNDPTNCTPSAPPVAGCTD